MRDIAQQAGGKVARGAQKPGSKEAEAAVKLPPSPAAHQEGSCSDQGNSRKLVLRRGQGREPDPKTRGDYPVCKIDRRTNARNWTTVKKRVNFCSRVPRGY